MTEQELRLYKRAMNKLSCGDYTPKGLYSKLIGKPDADHEAAKAVVKLLHKEGFLSEKRSFELLLREGERKFWGKRKLKEALYQRQFSEKYSLRLEEEDIDFASRAREFAERQGLLLPLDDKARASLYRKLLGKGFSSEEASGAVAELEKRAE